MCVELVDFCRTVEKSYFKSIIYISAMTSAESSNLHLVAITQSGQFRKSMQIIMKGGGLR